MTAIDTQLRRGLLKPFGLLHGNSVLTQYVNDPVAFVRDFVVFKPKPGEPVGLAPYQEECLAELPIRKRVAIRGPHGLGKTTDSALAILWFALTRDAEGDDWKIATTASKWIQLTDFLWPEIHKWSKALRWDLMGRPPFDSHHELILRHLHLTHGSAFAASPDEPAAIEGAHADRILYILDEAKTISAGTFDAIEGAFAGGGESTGMEALALCISTPGAPVGRFYQIHARERGYEDWWVRHVTLAEAIKAKRVSQEWADARARQWGVGSAVYQNRVLGEFATDATDAVIPLAWIEEAMLRWPATEPNGPVIFACDMAGEGEGGDETIICVKSGDWIGEMVSLPRANPMQIAGELAVRLRANPGSRATVDILPDGAGVVSRLREDGLNADAFVAGAGDTSTDESGELRFANRRSAGWWNLRSLLDPRPEPHPITGEWRSTCKLALPRDDVLLGDLVSPTHKMTSGGRIQVEGKDTIRQRLHRSTDRGDALMMACFPSEAMRMVIGTTADPNERGWRRLQGWN